MFIALSLLGLCTGCSGDDSDGAGSGGAAGASGVSGGGSGGIGGTSGGGTGGDIAVDPALPDGQVAGPWDQYCVATFTEDFEVGDKLGGVQLEVQAGDRYLLGAPGTFDEISLVYIGEGGPVEMEIAGSEEMMPPLTSSCSGATETRIAVFVDTVVYTDEALTMQAGLAVPGIGVNYESAGPAYSVELQELADACGGVAEGFVQTVHVETDLGGHFGVPFATLLAPAP
jgi:hypothetical protein